MHSEKEICISRFLNLYNVINGNNKGILPHHILHQVIKTESCDEWFSGFKPFRKTFLKSFDSIHPNIQQKTIKLELNNKEKERISDIYYGSGFDSYLYMNIELELIKFALS